MRMPRYAVTAFALAVLSISARRAESQAPQQPALNPATDAAIRPIVDRARAANLPVELLIAKAREGEVRRAPVERIESAVRQLAERIATAHDALTPNPTDREVEAAADALKAGVPRETLRAMRAAGKEASLAVPIGVLTQLVLRGVPVERASVQVVNLLQRGALSGHFIALDDRVRADVLAGKRPDESLDLRLKGIFPNLPQQATADAAGLQTTAGNKKPR